MTKYRVYFEKTGYIDVDAENPQDAEKIAMQEEVICDDDWMMVDETETVEQAEKL